MVAHGSVTVETKFRWRLLAKNLPHKAGLGSPGQTFGEWLFGGRFPHYLHTYFQYIS